jgi:hypothetical protein
MRRHSCLGLAIICIGVLAAIPVASAQAATCGPTWTVAPARTLDSAFLLSASADSSGDAMAAGFRSLSNGVDRPIAEQWNGKAFVFTTVPNRGDESLFSGITRSSKTSAVAVGTWRPTPNDPQRAFAEVWDGSSWTISDPVTFQNGSTFLRTFLEGAASTSPSNVWAAGVFVNAAGVEVPLIEHFDGTSWSVSNAMPVGDGGELVNVATDAANDAWAVGFESTNGGSSQEPLAEHWNGSAWQPVATPTVGTLSALNGVAVNSATDAWAVGTTFNLTSNINQPITMHWNGTRWQTVEVPSPSVNGAILQSVTALGPNDVWAFGLQFVDALGDAAPLIEHWNGSFWSVADSAPGSPAPGDSGFLFGSAFVPGTWTVLAVGYTQANDGSSPAVTNAQELCPVQVQNSGYIPATARAPFGTSVYWSMPSSNNKAHSATDGSGTSLFDSGLIDPGGSFDFFFSAAGAYTVTDSAAGGQTGTIDVTMLSTPTTGTTATTFNIQWASGRPPRGYVYDVQVKRPGDSTYSDFVTGTTATGATFAPDAGTGTYRFHSRLRRQAPTASTKYSPQLTITVGSAASRVKSRTHARRLARQRVSQALRPRAVGFGLTRFRCCLPAAALRAMGVG